jgi:hypothetical protein
MIQGSLKGGHGILRMGGIMETTVGIFPATQCRKTLMTAAAAQTEQIQRCQQRNK